jgi:hypothetical protein
MLVALFVTVFIKSTLSLRTYSQNQAENFCPICNLPRDIQFDEYEWLFGAVVSINSL